MSLVVIPVDDLREIVTEAVTTALRQQGSTAAQAGPGWLRASEAATRLNVSRSTIGAWLIDGTIPENARLACGRTHRIAAWWVAGRRAA